MTLWVKSGQLEFGKRMHFWILWKSVLEIGFIWILIYSMIRFLQGTRAVQVLTGLLILVVLFNVAKILELSTINWVLTKLFAVGVLAFLILFQPELRRALARIGQNTVFNPFLKKGGTVDEVVEACARMSRMKRGALIAIQRDVGLKNYVESGIPLDARISSELLITIFAANVPTHDGAVIIEGNRLASASSLFPEPRARPRFGNASSGSDRPHGGNRRRLCCCVGRNRRHFCFRLWEVDTGSG